MSTADPIVAAGAFYPDTIDPMMSAIRQGIIDASTHAEILAQIPALAEFGERQVVIIAPEETDEGIEAAIAEAIGRKGGLCLLLIAGSGKNPHTDAPGPRVNIELEAQLLVATRLRKKDASSPLVLMAAIAKFLHHQQIRVTGFPWYEEIIFTGFDPLPDPDFTGYALTFTRETTL